MALTANGQQPAESRVAGTGGAYEQRTLSERNLATTDELDARTNSAASTNSGGPLRCKPSRRPLHRLLAVSVAMRRQQGVSSWDRSIRRSSIQASWYVHVDEIPDRGSTLSVARIYREHPDSSDLAAPRIFARVFCQPGQLIETVRFYEQLTQARLDMDMDMDIPEAGLHVVAVGSFLILELDPEQHILASQTTVTVLNADLDQAVARQVAAGAEIVQKRWKARSAQAPDCAIPTV
jgi:predicted enzyme related to lactoylglutathione lyase